MTRHHEPDSSAHQPFPIDMSPEAVDERLRDLSDLWDFWTRLEIDRRDGRLVVRPEPGSGPSPDSRPESGSADKEDDP